ncbi:MAG TPA: O-antigen ligase family protein [Galbitalea sp.]|jgi:O-antigen ligase|nr:O-antigen ligase family protein [Galbitalea sp.]
MVKSRTWLSVYAVALFFTVLSGDTLRYGLTWYGWGVAVGVLFVISLVIVIRRRHDWRLVALPLPLLTFVALTIASIAWSAYRGWTAAGAFATFATVVGAFAVSLSFSLPQLIRLFGHALRIVLLASILFELVVSTFVRHPFTPWWTHYQAIHPADNWSRDLLFAGGRIQGIMGNSDLLGFVALLGVLVFAVEFASRSIHRAWSGIFLVVAVIDIALTRSATVFVAIVVVAVAAIVLVVIRHTKTPASRRAAGIVSLIVILVGAAGVFVFRAQIVRLLGKSGTLTGRTGIWAAVAKLAEQRPVAGWGWLGYWPPHVAPYDEKVFRIGGIQYLQAHDAWLDVWVQLGIIGVVVFAALVISALVRAWTIAIDRPQLGARTSGRYDPATLLPVLVLIALIAQSIAESRLLIEYGLLLLALIAIKTKRPDPDMVRGAAPQATVTPASG